MSVARYIPLVVKQVVRHRIRTGLTVSGIAIAMFLFTTIQAMQRGVTAATQETAADTTLVVYRKDRFCPLTSLLPQDYLSRINRIQGVESVMPVKVFSRLPLFLVAPIMAPSASSRETPTTWAAANTSGPRFARSSTSW